MASKPRNGSTGAPAAKEDVVLIHGVTADGRGLEVLRKQGESLSAGTVRPLEEGKPITGDVVRLKPREDLPILCDVEVQHEATPPRREATGPARVATDGYRSGWESIWGKQRKKTRVLN